MCQDTIVAIGRADDGRVHVSNLRPGFSEEDFGTNPDEVPFGLYTLICLQKGQPFSDKDINGLTELILLCLQLVARTDHSWVNYVMASFKGVCGYVLAEKCQQIRSGLNMMVEGQVPQGEHSH